MSSITDLFSRSRSAVVRGVAVAAIPLALGGCFSTTRDREAAAQLAGAEVSLPAPPASLARDFCKRPPPETFDVAISYQRSADAVILWGDCLDSQNGRWWTFYNRLR